MSKGWLILAAVLGTLAGAVAWSWPREPLWRSAGVGWGRFSPDSQILVTVDEKPLRPVIYRWQARTGKLVDRIELSCEQPRESASAYISRDGSQALVWRNYEWCLHERWTGRRLCTLPEGLVLDPRPFSPDGKWFIGLRNLCTNVFIHSAQTGEIVSAVPGIANRHAPGMRDLFAPDSGSIAIRWIVDDQDDEVTPDIVQILELPSGRELRRFVMPRRAGFQVRRWDGRFLTVVEHTMDELNDENEVEKGWVFDAEREGNSPVHDPMLWGSLHCLLMPITLWQDGPGWVGYCTQHVESRQEQMARLCKDWLSKRASIKFREPPAFDISIVDRVSGKRRFVTALPEEIPHQFSDDGKLLVSHRFPNHIEVWDADPPSRLPAAIGVGALSGVSVLAFGRWRTVRRQRIPHKGCIS